jgi:hypothetical protein
VNKLEDTSSSSADIDIGSVKLRGSATVLHNIRLKMVDMRH